MKSKLGYDIIKSSLAWENELLLVQQTLLDNALKNIEKTTKDMVLCKMRIDDLEAELTESSTSIK